MTITSHIQEIAFGYTVNYKLYSPVIPSNNYLLCFHGVGETGPIDGSLLNDVEVHGYPKHAKAGFEFPFNIVAVQAQSSYSSIRKFLPAYIKLKYGAEVIIATGLSMGGFCTFDIPLYDHLNLIYAIAPVCGGIAASKALTYPDLPGWAFHGDQDEKVKYYQSKNFVDAYNTTHVNKWNYTLYPGVAHDSWNEAYSVKPGEDQLLQWINKQFSEAPKLNSMISKQKLIDIITNL